MLGKYKYQKSNHFFMLFLLKRQIFRNFWAMLEISIDVNLSKSSVGISFFTILEEDLFMDFTFSLMNYCFLDRAELIWRFRCIEFIYLLALSYYSITILRFIKDFYLDFDVLSYRFYKGISTYTYLSKIDLEKVVFPRPELCVYGLFLLIY